MTKTEFENKIQDWATNFINSDPDLTLVEIFKSQNISRVSHPILDVMPASKICDFICDFVFLVKQKEVGYQLILLNRYVKSIGIKDIGEMLVYSKIANPIYAFLISDRGHSTEINNILVNEVMSVPLFRYAEGKNLVLFALKDKVKRESLLPVFIRDLFYDKINCI
jgi:hypothetical protein